MRTIWNVIAVMALVHVLAIGGGLLWLKMSNRMHPDRFQAARAIFAKTLDEEAAEKAAKEAAEKAAVAQAEEAAKMARPPASSTEKIAEQQFREDQRLQVLLRQQQELENLRTSLMTQLTKLEEREKKLDVDKRAFADERKRIAEAEGTAQFQQALATLEGQKAKDAKDVLKAMLDRKEEEQVVAYLARMEDGKRTKVIAEFVKSDATVAADLLERLRTRGVGAPGRPSAASAPSLPNSQVVANDPGIAGTNGGERSGINSSGARASR